MNSYQNWIEQSKDLKQGFIEYKNLISKQFNGLGVVKYMGEGIKAIKSKMESNNEKVVVEEETELSISEVLNKLSLSRISDAERLARHKERHEAMRIEKDMKMREKELEKHLESERLEALKKEEEAKKAASKLLRPLTDEEKIIVKDALYGAGSENEILAKSDTDSVLRKSMRTLLPGRWLNDEVIHYFYLMLSRRDETICNNQEGKKRSHFFKSFFLTKLLDESGTEKYNYSNVKRWSKVSSAMTLDLML